MAFKIAESLKSFRRPKQIDLEDYIAKLKARGLTANGDLVPDPVPIAPPIGYKKTPSMVEIVRDMVRSEKLAQAAREMGKETFEESEDFDVPEDNMVDRSSPWENEFDPPLEVLLQAGREALAAKNKPPEEGSGGGSGGASPDKAPTPPAPPQRE